MKHIYSAQELMPSGDIKTYDLGKIPYILVRWGGKRSSRINRSTIDVMNAQTGEIVFQYTCGKLTYRAPWVWVIQI